MSQPLSTNRLLLGLSLFAACWLAYTGWQDWPVLVGHLRPVIHEASHAGP